MTTIKRFVRSVLLQKTFLLDDFLNMRNSRIMKERPIRKISNNNNNKKNKGLLTSTYKHVCL